MAYKGGTRDVKICIERLKELELLIDVYSNEWLAKKHDFCDFYQESLRRHIYLIRSIMPAGSCLLFFFEDQPVFFP